MGRTPEESGSKQISFQFRIINQLEIWENVMGIVTVPNTLRVD